jgi:hypothetical protein
MRPLFERPYDFAEGSQIIFLYKEYANAGLKLHDTAQHWLYPYCKCDFSVRLCADYENVL